MSNDQHDKHKNSLRGNQDVFLADIRRSDEFLEIEDEYLSDVFMGIYGLLQRVIDEDDASGRKVHVCAVRISEVFGISKDTALKLLLTARHPATYGYKYRPRISRDGDEVVIRIGPKTTQADIKSAWKAIKGVQREIGGLGSKTSINPELAFLVHRQHILKGRKIADIFNDYSHKRLDGYEGKFPTMSENDFRKYYKGIVEGL